MKGYRGFWDIRGYIRFRVKELELSYYIINDYIVNNTVLNMGLRV